MFADAGNNEAAYAGLVCFGSTRVLVLDSIDSVFDDGGAPRAAKPPPLTPTRTPITPTLDSEPVHDSGNFMVTRAHLFQPFL